MEPGRDDTKIWEHLLQKVSLDQQRQPKGVPSQEKWSEEGAVEVDAVGPAGTRVFGTQVINPSSPWSPGHSPLTSQSLSPRPQRSTPGQGDVGHWQGGIYSDHSSQFSGAGQGVPGLRGLARTVVGHWDAQFTGGICRVGGRPSQPSAGDLCPGTARMWRRWGARFFSRMSWGAGEPASRGH